ncbi:nuclear transport factor 2 family protein [Sphingobacterium sp. SYP-B4668]|uniref:nuclear transport factor 2 family protein n=1 Tax=Sphingobacterium sp. SYP-B4668 TaxID=2996035 RepID=UPI0022DE01C3|nr:nuclear transport factor 2 family protein [Sphingobacterium sp. SYP-B4668]
MKKLITPFATALMMIVSFSSFAKTTNSNPSTNLSSKATIKAYLEAHTLSNLSSNPQLFASDFEYQTAAKPNEKFNKKQYSDFLKNTKGLQYDCMTTYEIMDENTNISVAKATMTFPNFKRVDYITLTRGQNSWQVSKVVTTYP